MSDTINNQQNQDNIPPAEDAANPTPLLPDFDTNSDEVSDEILSENDLFEISVKTSLASPSNLDDFLAAQRAGEITAPLQPTPDEAYRDTSVGADLTESITQPKAEAPAEQKSSTWQTAWSIIREVGETVLLTLIIFFIIQMFVRNFRVVGTSMVNNLQNGQYLIIDKVSYNPILMKYLNIGGPQRGDVIVFKPPRYPGEDYVKRIIGLPGEKVQVIKGQVYINDKLLDEPFKPIQGSYTMPAPVIVPENQVFVLGDNRNNSNDSHNWGPLPIENIVGRAWISYWPPNLWGGIPRDVPTEQVTLKHFLSQFIPSANAKNE